jgi:hypothetical protein
VAQQFNGYQLIVSQSGAWSLITNAAKGSPNPPQTLLSGDVGTALTPGTFYPISLSVEGATLSVNVDGSTGSTSDSTYPSGDAGVSTGGWYPVQFTNLQVTG